MSQAVAEAARPPVDLAELRHLAIEQRVLMNVKTVDTRAYFVGMTLPSPIIVAPMGWPSAR